MCLHWPEYRQHLTPGSAGNHLYNALPDLISHLSSNAKLDTEAFKNVMKFLLQFIEKDRQTEALVEKLCHRFRFSAYVSISLRFLTMFSSHCFLSSFLVALSLCLFSPYPCSGANVGQGALSAEQELQHARDMAFCLSLLNYNERVVKKLSDCWKLYFDKLPDEDVYASFQVILGKARKFAKPELKTLLDEFAARIEAARAKGIGEGEVPLLYAHAP